MTGKIFKAGVMLGLALLFVAGSAFAYDTPEKGYQHERWQMLRDNGTLERWEHFRKIGADRLNVPIRDFNDIKGGQEDYFYLNNRMQSVVNDMRWAGSQNSLLDVDTLTSPGMLVGITTYDLQHNSTQGHDIGANTGGAVHMVWTYWDRIPLAANEKDRYVRYNSWNGATFDLGFDGAVISLANWARAGYMRMDTDSQNKAHVALHQYPEDGFCCYSCYHIYMAVDGGSTHFDAALTPIDPEVVPGAEETNWPAICITQNDPTGDTNLTDVYHVFGTGAIDNGDGTAIPADILAYWRFDQDPVNNPAQEWTDPVIVDSSETLDYECDAADDGSGKVALCFTNNTEPQFNELLNLGYRESFTEGLGWIDGTELGDSLRTWVTDHHEPNTSPPGPQVWGYCSIAYDHSGVLHLTWIEQREANTSPDHNAIYHYNDMRGTNRLAVLAFYDNDGNYPGAQNLNYATFGVGDGTSTCNDVGGDNTDFLYLVYSQHCGPTQEEIEDISAQGICNAELYITGSADRGFTWSPPQNLTNTKTPQCNPSSDPDSVCSSEQWATIARNVSDINISYVLDYEAGDFTSSGWIFNDYMYVQYPAGTDAQYVCPLVSPNYASILSVDAECEYHAPENMVNNESLTIINIGNAELSGHISVQNDNDSFLSVVPDGNYSIPAGDPDINATVTMDATGLAEGLYTADIRISHNDTTKADTVQTYPIDFYVVNDFHCPEDQILSTHVASPGVVALEMASDGRIANDNEGGMWRYVDSSSALFEASIVVGHDNAVPGPDTLMFHRFFNASPADDGQRGFRSLGDLYIDTSAYGTGAGVAFAQTKMCTKDSLVGVDAAWFYPQNADSAEFIIVEYTISNRTNDLATDHPNYNQVLNDVVVGWWADWDAVESAKINVQQSSDNDGDYLPGSNLLYVIGRDTALHNNGGNHFFSSKRYAGGMAYLYGRNGGGGNEINYDAQAIRCGFGDNRENQAVNGGPSSGLMYSKLVGTPGFSLFSQVVSPDSNGLSDLYGWLTLDQGLTLNPGESQSYVIALLSDTLGNPLYPNPGADEGLSSFETGFAKAKNLAENDIQLPIPLGCCPTHGDPTTPGVIDVFDVVAAVDVAFRGGTPHFDFACPNANTDVVSCFDLVPVVDVFDVVAFVDVAFRGGSESQFCDPCNGL